MEGDADAGEMALDNVGDSDHGGLGGVGALFFGDAAMLAVPKIQGLRTVGIIRLFGEEGDSEILWMFSFLNDLRWTWQSLAWWIILAAAVLWGLFEWRVRGENKAFMRLAALGMLALGMTVLTVITAWSIELPIFRQLPAMGRISTSAAIRRMATIDAAVAALEQAMDKKDWDAAQKNADRAIKEIRSLSAAVGWFNETTPPDEQPIVDQFQCATHGGKQIARGSAGGHSGQGYRATPGGLAQVP